MACEGGRALTRYPVLHLAQRHNRALLFEELRKAADRGVRVRLLLDDTTTAGLDATLAALDSHPNIEIHLFNPFAAVARLTATGSRFTSASMFPRACVNT